MDLSNVLIAGLYGTACVVSLGLAFKFFSDWETRLWEIKKFESQV